MKREAAICIGLFVMRAAGAAVPDGTAALPQATGTPSSATATVSPSTVAEAVDHLDRGEAHFDLSLGTSIASGKFGTDRSSRLLSTALGLRYANGPFRLSASLPYLDIRSSGVIFSGIDSTPVIAAAPGAGPRVTHHGIGDLTLGAAYTAVAQGAAPEVEFSARVKVPTAGTSNGLSTGKADVSLGVQVTRSVGRFAPFVAASYRFFGDPGAIRLRDGFAASVGTAAGLDRRTVALASYHYAAAASRLVPDSHELFAGLSHQVGDTRFRLTGFVTAGLSSGAAARSGGISLAYGF